MAVMEEPLLSTRNLVGTIVAPRPSATPKDHISSTKTFSQLKSNGILNALPSAVAFEGFLIETSYTKSLKLTNESSDPQRLLILPPLTKEFKIHYLKKGSLYPGMQLEVKIKFSPKEWKYYYDCIRIHCSNDKTLLVPIHAYPVISVKQLLPEMTFPVTPLHKSSKKSFTLLTDVPVEFQFKIIILEDNASYHITPMEGVVPSRGRVSVTITYSPTDFTTAIMKFQLDVSQFNWKPVTCTCVGTSTPGLALDKYKMKDVSIAPLERLKLKRMNKKKSFKSSATKQRSSGSLASKPQEVIHQGYRIPVNLLNPKAVAKVLCQEPGKLKASELRQSNGALGPLAERQLREGQFLQRVREAEAEERASQYKWSTKLGGSELSGQEREAILADRQHVGHEYNDRLQKDFREFSNGNKTFFKRTVRKWNQAMEVVPKFDDVNIDSWQRRHAVQVRFANCARKVLVQCRAQRRLEKLKSAINRGLEYFENEPKEEIPIVKPTMAPEQIVSFSFPSSDPLNEPQTSKQSLGPVPVECPSCDIQRAAPLLELLVAEEYKLLGYEPHPLPAMDSYVLPGLPRPLLTGSGDYSATATRESNAKHATFEEERSLEITDIEDDNILEGFSLVAPSHIFKPTDCKPLDIYFPCKNMCPSLPLQAMSEADRSRHLLPLQRYPTDQAYIQEECVVPDVLTWKEHKSTFVQTVIKGQLRSETLGDCISQRAFMKEMAIDHVTLLTGPNSTDFVDREGTDMPSLEELSKTFYIPEELTSNKITFTVNGKHTQSTSRN